MRVLSPFFSYYGSKWRISAQYHPPRYSRIIEPFAGSAGYATRYYQSDVLLVDTDPIIYGIWDFLIRSSEADILRLPIGFSHTDEISVCQEAKWLIGFWITHSNSSPKKTVGGWAKDPRWLHQFWGETIRARLASQVELIKHWQIKLGSFQEIPNQLATWFVDPPYSVQGCYYRYSQIDYPFLSVWCRTRLGQTMVCEQNGATWLPFKRFMTNHSIKKYTVEMYWHRETNPK